MSSSLRVLVIVKCQWQVLMPILIVLQDEITKRVYTHYGNYKVALIDAHSEYYLGKDCWGTR